GNREGDGSPSGLFTFDLPVWAGGRTVTYKITGRYVAGNRTPFQFTTIEPVGGPGRRRALHERRCPISPPGQFDVPGAARLFSKLILPSLERGASLMIAASSWKFCAIFLERKSDRLHLYVTLRPNRPRCRRLRFANQVTSRSVESINGCRFAGTRSRIPCCCFC